MNIGKKTGSSLARGYVTRFMMVAPLGLAACYSPHVISGQDALFCEQQGLRPGSDANFECAVKREAEREQAGAPPLETPPQTPLAAAAPPPPAHAGGVAQITPQAIPPGTTRMINFSISVNADCIFTGMPTVRIDKAPANGTVQVVQRIDFARVSQSGSPESCGDKKVSGISVEYTPNKNYIGSDVVQFEITTLHGRTDYKVPITVDKPADDDD